MMEGVQLLGGSIANDVKQHEKTGGDGRVDLWWIRVEDGAEDYYVCFLYSTSHHVNPLWVRLAQNFAYQKVHPNARFVFWEKKLLRGWWQLIAYQYQHQRRSGTLIQNQPVTSRAF